MRRWRAVAASGLALTICAHLGVGAAWAETRSHAGDAVEIEGQPSPDGATLLSADPGWYVSGAPGVDETLYYQVERTNPRTHLAVGLRTRTREPLDGIRVQMELRTRGGVWCDHTRTWDTSAAEPRHVLTLSVSDSTGDTNKKDRRACERADRFVLAIWREAVQDEAFDGTPMDIVVYEEPRANNPSDLPKPDSPPEWRPVASSDRKKVEGAEHMFGAEPLEPGSYKSTISPGEQLFFRVDLDWGEALQAHVRVPRPTDGVADAVRLPGDLHMDGQVLGPTLGVARVWENIPDETSRATLTEDSASELRVWTDHVRYRNRTVDERRSTRMASAPGPYYVVLTLSDSDASFDLPVELELETRGTPDLPPEYAEDAELLGPGWGARELPSHGAAARWLLGGGLALVVLGGGTLVGLRRGSPPAPETA